MFDFHSFPWSNFHGINQNWILERIKELYELLEGVSKSSGDQDLAHIVNNSGPGILRLRMTSETEMTLVDPVCYRTKADSTLHINVNMRNNTDADIPADTHLISFDYFITIDTAESDPDTPRRANLWGITCIIHETDGTVTAHNPYLEYVTGDKTYLALDAAIPVGARVIIMGAAPLSVTKNKVLLRGKHDAALADLICHTFLYGTPTDPWKPGDFTYSNGVHRLSPSYRESDCSGMTYIAYHENQLRPSRSSVATSYWADGMVIAYAPPDQPLDLSQALPADIICYHLANDPTRIIHCSLYAGHDVTYEMSSNYTDAENAAGAVDGQGPYRINTSASVYKNNYGRYVVRFL